MQSSTEGSCGPLIEGGGTARPLGRLRLFASAGARGIVAAAEFSRFWLARVVERVALPGLRWLPEGARLRKGGSELGVVGVRWGEGWPEACKARTDWYVPVIGAEAEGEFDVPLAGAMEEVGAEGVVFDEPEAWDSCWSRAKT